MSLAGSRRFDAAEALEDAPGLVDDAADGGGLGALAVELVLHRGDELLARLVGAIFVEAVVDVEEEGADVLYFLGALRYERNRKTFG